MNKFLVDIRNYDELAIFTFYELPTQQYNNKYNGVVRSKTLFINKDALWQRVFKS